MTGHNGDRDAALLSGLIDGALEPHEDRELATRLPAEPDLVRRLEAMRDADTAVRNAYASVADEQLPSHLVALLEGDSAVSMRASDVVVPLRGRFRPVPRPRRDAWLPLAAAASVALAVGVAIGIAVPDNDRSDTVRLAADGSVSPGEPLFEVIETVGSRESRAVGADVAVPELTFRSASGDFCRQLSVSGDSGFSRSVVCREDGAWRIRMTEFAPTGPLSDGATYRPASGGTASIDAFVDTLIAGPPLGAAEERAVMSAGWAGTALSDAAPRE
jgi:hypothetical protein